jgi:glycosyltransferase involved in cell wall biosynthesis
MEDCVVRFFEFYRKGNLVQAVQEILPSPDFSYDQLQSSSDLLQPLINFVDASIFGRTAEVKVQNIILCHFLKLNASKLNHAQTLLEHLKYEEQWLSMLLGQKAQSEEDQRWLSLFQKMAAWEKGEISQDISEMEVPENIRSLVEFHQKMTLGWQKFNKHKPFLSHLEYIDLRPWYPMRYYYPLSSYQYPAEQVPFIFFEPIQEDLSDFLISLQGLPAIFAFTTLSVFFQMLQFPSFVEALIEKHHLVYILELYPHQQFAHQDLSQIKSKELYPLILSPSPFIKDYAPALSKGLKACFSQSPEQYNTDTPEGNWVYEITKRLLSSLQQKRLGRERLPSLHVRQGQMRWYDRHKGLAPTGKNFGPEMYDPMKELLTQLAEKRVPRKRQNKGKLLIAHIVPQIVSGGHAPTRLLENLVLNHDSQKFEVIVVSTECLRELPLEYPYNYYTSPSSEERGAPTLHKFKQLGVKVFLNYSSLNYRSNAEDLSRLLKSFAVDVAVFHGPDIIHTMAAQMVDVPFRVLFEHGSQAAYPGFDLAIVSSDAAAELYGDLYKKLQTRIIALPFALDIRQGWQTELFSRKTLGLPEQGMIMTTISTKLDARLTDEFCHTIAEILQRVPEACYAPIGDLNHPERIKEIFAHYGVEDRFFPMGHAQGPASQYARSMQLYLNEFPFGGCLAILDAMAAGCPVVTMYDPQGPQQARYGGHFIGLDRAIKTGKKKDYIELACQLLTNPELYQEWSRHSLKQYEKFADVKGYVKEFEKIILENFWSLSN